MKTITLSARFDGEQIRLDEPFDLKPNTRMMVTILPEEEVDLERSEWYALAAQGLARAYGDDEPEYTVDMIKEKNPNYEGS